MGEWESIMSKLKALAICYEILCKHPGTSDLLGALKDAMREEVQQHPGYRQNGIRHPLCNPHNSPE